MGARAGGKSARKRPPELIRPTGEGRRRPDLPLENSFLANGDAVHKHDDYLLHARAQTDGLR